MPQTPEISEITLKSPKHKRPMVLCTPHREVANQLAASMLIMAGRECGVPEYALVTSSARRWRWLQERINTYRRQHTGAHHDVEVTIKYRAPRGDETLLYKAERINRWVNAERAEPLKTKKTLA